MGAVVDRLDLDLAEMKAYLGVTVATYDDLLTDLFGAAKEIADEYLNNEFLDPDDGSELPIPGPVKYGVYTWAGQMSRIPGLGLGVGAGGGGAASGVKAEKAGDVSRTFMSAGQMYSSQSAGGGYLTNEVAMFWQPYRILPGM